MRPKSQALGKPPVLGVEAPGGAVPLSHALVTITFKGRMTRADNDRWCTTPGRLARETKGAVHPARCPAGPDVEQQYVQLTRTPNLWCSTAPPRGVQRGRIAQREAICMTPCWLARGTEACSRHGIPRDRAWGSSTSGTRGHRESGARAGSDAVRCSPRQHRPARPNGSPPRYQVPMPRPSHTVELGAFKSMMNQQSWVPSA